MSAYNPQYTLHSISFRNLEHGNAFNALRRGERPKDWQIAELERFLEELKSEELPAGHGLL